MAPFAISGRAGSDIIGFVSAGLPPGRPRRCLRRAAARWRRRHDHPHVLIECAKAIGAFPATSTIRLRIAATPKSSGPYYSGVEGRLKAMPSGAEATSRVETMRSTAVSITDTVSLPVFVMNMSLPSIPKATLFLTVSGRRNSTLRISTKAGMSPRRRSRHVLWIQCFLIPT